MDGPPERQRSHEVRAPREHLASASPRPPVSVREFCLAVLQRGDLPSKLAPPRGPDGRWLPDDDPGPPLVLDAPARDPEIALDTGKSGAGERLPRLDDLHDRIARARCLERFANHELMAVELFAWALLAYPDLPRSLRRGFLRVLEEEQTHLRLYLDRLSELDWFLGRTPLGDYFWQQVPALRESPHGVKAFLAAMGLTFEQANLDYALLYRDAFRRAGDERSARAIERVHRDEIGHVRLAAVWFRRLDAEGKGDIALYEETIPFPLSAARAKARRFDVESRTRAGLSPEMIAYVRAAVPYRRAAVPVRPDASAGFVLFTNVGDEEDGWALRAAPKIEAIGAIWPLALGRAPEGCVARSSPRQPEVRSTTGRLHPAFLEWLDRTGESPLLRSLVRATLSQDP
ncbi:MAG: DUF455 family protein, partial [Candidatus Eisenbacteria bacterium]|nr:DUF455 family protein [Candidatus Eisenbacteria bacterium]